MRIWLANESKILKQIIPLFVFSCMASEFGNSFFNRSGIAPSSIFWMEGEFWTWRFDSSSSLSMSLQIVLSILFSKWIEKNMLILSFEGIHQIFSLFLMLNSSLIELSISPFIVCSKTRSNGQEKKFLRKLEIELESLLTSSFVSFLCVLTSSFCAFFSS